MRARPRGPPGTGRPARPRPAGASTIPRARLGRRGPSSAHHDKRPAALLAELLVEDLADEAIDRDGIEANVRGRDDPGVDHLALREFLEDALDVAVRVPLLTADLELLALERDTRGIAEAEHPRDQALVHQLRLLEHLAVRRTSAGADDEPRRDLDAPANLHRASGLVVRGTHQDVGQHAIARDDPGEGLAHHLLLVEDV